MGILRKRSSLNVWWQQQAYSWSWQLFKVRKAGSHCQILILKCFLGSSSHYGGCDDFYIKPQPFGFLESYRSLLLRTVLGRVGTPEEGRTADLILFCWSTVELIRNKYACSHPLKICLSGVVCSPNAPLSITIILKIISCARPAVVQKMGYDTINNRLWWANQYQSKIEDRYRKARSVPPPTAL